MSEAKLSLVEEMTNQKTNEMRNEKTNEKNMRGGVPQRGPGVEPDEQRAGLFISLTSGKLPVDDR